MLPEHALTESETAVGADDAAVGEALALWAGRRVHVALAAAGAGSFCATTGWLDTFEAVTRPQPLGR